MICMLFTNLRFRHVISTSCGKLQKKKDLINFSQTRIS